MQFFNWAMQGDRVRMPRQGNTVSGLQRYREKTPYIR